MAGLEMQDHVRIVFEVLVAAVAFNIVIQMCNIVLDNVSNISKL